MAGKSKVYPDIEKSHKSHNRLVRLKLPQIVEQVLITDNFKLSDGSPTDAFGELEFVGSSEKRAKFIRVGSGASVDDLYDVTKKWGMRPPNFIISVTGGAQNFKMKSSLTKIFRKSLIKVAENTGAWIVTGGTNCGVMRHVGKAVKEYAVVKSSDEKVVALGIAPWGAIRNRHQLQARNRKNFSDPAQYSHDKNDPRYGNITSLLDKNHTHFILVDDGSENKYGIEIDLRARFESHVANRSSKKGVKVFIVCVIVQGGPGSLDTVYSALKQGTPAVVVDGSGGWASILGSLYPFSHTAVTDQLVKELMREQGMTNFDQLNKLTNTAKECIRMKENMNLFQVDNEDNIADLDVAVLEAIFNNPDLRENRKEQLKLALAWDRSDIAHSHILTDDAEVSQEDLSELFLEALYEDKTEFVQLFLDHGLNLKSFFTTEKLVELYQNSVPNSIIEFLMKRYCKDVGSITLSSIGKMMKSLMGHTYKSPYSHFENNQQSVLESSGSNQMHEAIMLTGAVELEERDEIHRKFFNPLRELFQWSVLMNRRKTAAALWASLWEGLPAAVMATRILKSLATKAELRENKSDLLEHADDFEKLAVGVLTQFYEKDPDIATESITRKVKQWGNMTCLETAVKAESKDFISHPAVQYLLSKIWLGGMAEKTSPYQVVLCTVIPPIIPSALQFESVIVTANTNAKDSENGVVENTSKLEDPTTFNKFSMFFEAPIVKFWYNVYFYVAFLLLFTYILVFNFYGNTASLFEYILVGWVGCLAMDEIKQISQENHKHVRKRIRIWFQDSWNKMDLLAITLFGIGFGLRFNYLDTARIILSISFIVFCLRILHIFTIHKALGPKLIMVGNMLRDLGFFVFILFVFLVAYGVASQSILYPNETDFQTAFIGIFSKAYWHIYGELFLAEISYNPTDDEFACTDNATLISAGERRCPTQQAIVPVLSAVYLLLANVLLLNLLIAMFSYTFDNLVQNTDSLWKYQRYELIHEYSNRPWLATPLSAFHHVWGFFTSCCCREDGDNFFCFEPEDSDEKKLVLWERVNADVFVAEQKRRQRELIENRVQGISDRIEELVSTVDSVRETLKYQKKVKKKVKAIERQNKETNEALKWVISALKDNKMVPKILHKAVHQKAREINYPASEIKRLEVPDHLVQWTVPWLEYSPPVYTAPSVLVDSQSEEGSRPTWADISLEEVNAVAVNLPFNTFDSAMKVDRKSYLGKYDVVDGIPRNPEGRTGLKGRGLLGRYGPNHAADPIVTRWEVDNDGDVIMKDGKHVLQFAAIKRQDNNEWAIPGGMVDPDEMLSRTLQREFGEEVELGGGMERGRLEELKRKIDKLFKCHGQEVFRGYCDDPRNTDNAWIETMVYNFHDVDGSVLGNIQLNPGDEVTGAKWMRMERSLKLYASHQQFIEKVAKMHNAYF